MKRRISAARRSLPSTKITWPNSIRSAQLRRGPRQACLESRRRRGAVAAIAKRGAISAWAVGEYLAGKLDMLCAVTDLSVDGFEMDGIPPGIRYRIRDVLARLTSEDLGGSVAPFELRQLLDECEPWIAADPGLAEVGYWLIDAARSVELRRFGCRWLTSFPSLATMNKLAIVALDPATPGPVRDQAIWALGHRQVCARHPSTLWSAAAVARADDALVDLADAATKAGRVCSRELPEALRHVQWEGASAIYARAPGLWGAAIECFGSPALARVLLVCLPDIPPRHRRRAAQLCAAVLGEEAVPMLCAHASQAPLDDRLEMLFLVIGLAGEAKLGLVEDALKQLPNAGHHRERAAWHLQHPGAVPVVRALRVARSLAAISVGDRVGRCGQAADDLRALSGFAPYEPHVYRLWAWLVRGVRDPARAGELVAVNPQSQYDVGDLYLEDLARRGHVRLLISTAHALHRVDIGAMYLAMWGKPIAALELAATAPRNTPEVAVARSLGCYRAGRPDVAQRILEEDLPPPAIVDDESSSSYPGPHERWLIERAPEVQPAVVAVAAGLSGVLARAEPAPFDGEPDASRLAALDAIAQRAARPLPAQAPQDRRDSGAD